MNVPIIYNFQISFDLLKTALIENSIDKEVKEFLEKKTKRGMVSFFTSNLFNTYNGGSKGRRGNRMHYSRNFEKTESIIANYLIQNYSEYPELSIKIRDLYFMFHYRTEVPNFESELNTELEITKDITKSIIRKINSIKYDFRKINFNLLKLEIDRSIKERILCVEKGEQVKCIESSQSGLTLGSFYNVHSYRIGMNGNLIVNVRNDIGINSDYNYRLFETVAKLRENNINDILNLIEYEG